MVAGAGAIRAGRAFVELFAIDHPLVRGLSAAGAKLRAFGTKVSLIGAGITAMGLAITVPLLKCTKVFATMGDTLDKMSARTGASVEFLQGLGHAAQLGGTDLATMEVSIRRVQHAAYDAEQGLTTAVDAFKELRVEVLDDNKQLKPTEVLFMDCAAALSTMENETKKAALASVLFGRGGTKLLPMLRDGKAGLIGMMEEYKKFAPLTREEVTAAAEYTDAMYRMKEVMELVKARIGAALAPMFTKLGDKIREATARVSQWLKENKPLVVALFKIGATIVLVGAAVTAFGMGCILAGAALTALGSMVGAVLTVFAVLKAAVLALLSPIGLVVAAAAVMGYVFFKYTSSGKRAIASLGEKWKTLKDTALKTVGGIKDALTAGDITLAAKILWAGVKVVWREGTLEIAGWWIDAKNKMLEAFLLFPLGIELMFYKMTAALKTYWEEFITFFRNAWTGAQQGIAKGFAWVIAKVEGLDPAAVMADVDRQYDRLDKAWETRHAARMAEIQHEHDARIKAIGEEGAAILESQEAARKAAMAGLHEELARARAELDALVADAKRKKEEAGVGAAAAGEGGPIGVLNRMPEAVLRGVAGSFSAAVAMRMGRERSAEDRIAEAAEQTAENTEAMAETLDEIKDDLALEVGP